MDYQNIQCDIGDDRIAVVTIERPKQLNALDRQTLRELDCAFEALGANGAVAAIVLTGAGEKAFAAGADIAELAALGPLAAQAYSSSGQRVMSRLETLGKPVLAAINGFALGGGLELAMACTLRVAAESAQLGLPEVTLGVIPGFGGTQRLPRLIGKGRALELLLTGDRIPAAEALRLGLVNKVVPLAELMPSCRELAARIASRAPLAITAILECVERGLDSPFEQGQALEASLFGLSFATEDMKEGTTAFLEKRKPRFNGR